MNIGTATYNGQTEELRDYPYRDKEDNLVCPLLNGTDWIFSGNWYPVNVSYSGLEYSANEEITLVGNNKIWSK